MSKQNISNDRSTDRTVCRASDGATLKGRASQLLAHESDLAVDGENGCVCAYLQNGVWKYTSASNASTIERCLGVEVITVWVEA